MGVGALTHPWSHAHLPRQEAGNLSILFDVGGVLGGAVAGWLSGEESRLAGPGAGRKAAAACSAAQLLVRKALLLPTAASPACVRGPCADTSGASALVSFGFVFSAIPFLYMYRVFGEVSFAGEALPSFDRHIRSAPGCHLLPACATTLAPHRCAGCRTSHPSTLLPTKP